MRKQRGETSAGGVGFFGLLGAIFITLKVVDVKPIGDWSWWWVTAPIWGGFLVVFAITYVCWVIIEIKQSKTL